MLTWKCSECKEKDSYRPCVLKVDYYDYDYIDKPDACPFNSTLIPKWVQEEE